MRLAPILTRCAFALALLPLAVSLGCPPTAADDDDDDEDDDNGSPACDLPCGPNARCDATRTGDPECVCVAGYEGADCDSCSHGYRADGDTCVACLDEDLDGHIPAECGGRDCDDGDARVPSSFGEGFLGSDTCIDNLDNDCNGLLDRDDEICQIPCNADGWCMVREAFSGGLFEASFAFAPDDMWIGGEAFISGGFNEVAAVVHHFDGERFTTYELPDHHRTQLLYGLAPDDLWATGFEQLLHWDGTSWIDLSSQLVDGRAPDIMWGSAPDDVWGVTFDLAFLHWDGTSWTQVRGPSNANGFSTPTAMHGCASDDIWVVQGRSILRFDGTRLLEWTGAPEFSGALGLAGGPGELFVANDALYGFNGSALERDMDDPLTGFRTVAGSGNDVWAAGDDGALAHWDGTAWTPVDAGSGSDWLFSASPAPGEVLLGTRGGAVQRWDGTTLTTVVSESFRSYDAMFLIDGTVGFAAEDDTLYTLSGSSWSTEDFVSRDINAIWASSATDAWAVGQDSTIFHFDGNNWDQVFTGVLPVDTNEPYAAVSGTGPDDVWVAGVATVLHWNGFTWSQVSTGGERGFAPRLHAASPNDIWLSWGNSLLHSQGGAFDKTLPSLYLRDVRCDAPDDVTLVGSEEEGISLMRYDGTRFTSLPEDPTFRPFATSIASRDEVWFVGSLAQGEPRIGRSVANLWTALPPPVTFTDRFHSLFTISMLSTGAGVIAGSDGAVYVRTP